MSYFQRVLFNDRLSELDYEIFWKMTWLMKGVTPDKFELVLMVKRLYNLDNNVSNVEMGFFCRLMLIQRFYQML